MKKHLSSLVTLLMYLLRKSNSGYRFETITGVEYEVYFTPLNQFEIRSEGSLLHENSLYYFGIERITTKKGVKKDIYLKRTIAFILFQFFTEYRDAVVVFNYSNDGNRIKARRKIFKNWFDEYSEFTLFQLYQHDYNDEVSVCALYRRRGGVKFESLKNDIERFIQNIGIYFDEHKIN